MMLIPRSDAVTTTVIKTKYSSSAGTAFVTFENAIVPKRNVFLAEGKGFQIIMSNFNHERWMICVFCLVRARMATEENSSGPCRGRFLGNPLWSSL